MPKGVYQRELTKKGINRKLDALVRQIVIERDKSCVTCPLWKKYKPDYQGHSLLTAGHLLTRGKGIIKYDLRNIFCQCKTCNYLHEERPEFLTSYAISVLGKEVYDELVFIGNQAKPIKLWQLVELYDNLKKSYNM
jgi:hypothetical protein